MVVSNGFVVPIDSWYLSIIFAIIGAYNIYKNGSLSNNWNWNSLQVVCNYRLHTLLFISRDVLLKIMF